MSSDPAVAVAALEPPVVVTQPGPEYRDAVRVWQGIPGIERAPGGRLWAVWYSGGPGEGSGNYLVVVTSDDDGHTWSAPALIVDPRREGWRAYDPCLWLDPLGRLWLFCAQSAATDQGRAGVWAVVTDDPDAATPAWSAPRRLCNGVMMNKPTVLSTGEWLLPAAVWALFGACPGYEAEQFSSVVVSTDQGATWTRRGGADVPQRSFDEHMVVELRDGRLWMLVRTTYGIGQSFSADGGFTWTPGEDSGLAGPCSRFFIRRLQSGNLLLVNHHGFQGRSHLTALRSDDDGRTWREGLLLDERLGVSYPDAVQAPDGTIYTIYDHDRGDCWSVGADKAILLAVFTEDDVIAGHCVSPRARLRQLVNRATGHNPETSTKAPA